MEEEFCNSFFIVVQSFVIGFQRERERERIKDSRFNLISRGCSKFEMVRFAIFFS